MAAANKFVARQLTDAQLAEMQREAEMLKRCPAYHKRAVTLIKLRRRRREVSANQNS